MKEVSIEDCIQTSKVNIQETNNLQIATLKLMKILMLANVICICLLNSSKQKLLLDTYTSWSEKLTMVTVFTEKMTADAEYDPNFPAKFAGR